MNTILASSIKKPKGTRFTTFFILFALCSSILQHANVFANSVAECANAFDDQPDLAPAAVPVPQLQIVDDRTAKYKPYHVSGFEPTEPISRPDGDFGYLYPTLANWKVENSAVINKNNNTEIMSVSGNKFRIATELKDDQPEQPGHRFISGFRFRAASDDPNSVYVLSLRHSRPAQTYEARFSVSRDLTTIVLSAQEFKRVDESGKPVGTENLDDFNDQMNHGMDAVTVEIRQEKGSGSLRIEGPLHSSHLDQRLHSDIFPKLDLLKVPPILKTMRYTLL
jgi:hypothetical protein